MKIAIITLHRVFNFGSALQAYATQKVFEDLGHEAEVIDYIPTVWQNKTLFGNFKEGGLKHKLYLLVRVFSVILKKLTFGSFLKKHVKLTKKYFSIAELRKEPPQADVYCAGSDQIWNSKYNGVDPAFFLDFGDDPIQRIAFSTSIGKTELPEEEARQFQTYIEKYQGLSVREDSACKVLAQMGFAATQVPDPTLMLQREDWLALASKRLIKEKYVILMLLYNEDNHATEYARMIADKMGLKLVKVSWELIKPKQIDRLMTHRTPGDFLSLFHHAEFVVTNSFHGLAFSINLNKQFIVVPRYEFNTRLESLLALTGLTERMVTDAETALAMTDKPIVYDKVNDKLQQEREKAKEFLKHALQA